MHRIEQLKQEPTLIFEGFEPPINLKRIIEEQLADLSVMDGKAFSQFLKEKKRHYRVVNGLLVGSATKMLHDDLIMDLDFAREDGELDFQCSTIDSAPLLNILTGYRMQGADTGWLFRNHFGAKTDEGGFSLLLPKE